PLRYAVVAVGGDLELPEPCCRQRHALRAALAEDEIAPEVAGRNQHVHVTENAPTIPSGEVPCWHRQRSLRSRVGHSVLPPNPRRSGHGNADSEPSIRQEGSMVIGEQISRLRHLRRLTQDELAAASGVSVDVIRRLEQGQRNTARLTTLSAIATALGAQLSV